MYPSPTTLTVTSLGDGSALNPVPLCIMANGYIVGGWNQVLYYSIDDGRTWTEAEILATSGRVLCVRELADGEIIATTDYSAGSYKGHIYKSSGWATNPVTATFTKVHETANTQGHFIDRSVAVSGTTVFVGEYGVQGYAQKAYISTDSAATFTQVFDMASYPTQCPDLANGHVHGVAIDTAYSRLYLATGDQENKGMWWADQATPTVWTRFYQEQPTTIVAARSGILWGTDNPTPAHGILRTRRDNLANVEVAWTAPEGVVGATVYTRGRVGDPIYFTFGPLGAGDQGYIVGTADGGETFHQLYAHPATSAVLRAYGPTDEDLIVGVLTDDGTSVWNPYWAKSPTWSAGKVDEASTVRRRWLPATAGYVVAGSAALGSASSRVPVALMDGASNETWAWYYEVPSHWRTWAADVHWLNTTTSSGDIVLAVTHNEITPNGGSITSNEVAESYLTCSARTSITLVKKDTIVASRANRLGIGHIRIQRRPGETADTLANDIGILGVLLRQLT